MAQDNNPLVPLKERADHTGENFETLRSQAQEGKLPGARKDNRGRWLAPLPQGSPREFPGDTLVAEMRALLAEARGEVERWRGEAQAAQIAAARAEAERDAAKDSRAAEVAALRELLSEVKTMLTAAREELADARRPWWRRLLG
jgi:hypothetical protein